jgi:hypothetical protein
MTELSGTLEGVGLPAIVRFLSGLKKTGCLHIAHNDWRGDIFFDLGRVIGASLGSRQGVSALDALVQALPGGSFTFDVAARPAAETTILLSTEALQAHLDDLAVQTANGTSKLPSFDAVPNVVAQNSSSAGDEPLPLDRGTLQTLLAVDGQRSVQAIVAQRGSLDALWQIANLVEVGLLELSANAAPAAAEVPVAETRPVMLTPAVEPIAAQPEWVPSAISRPFGTDMPDAGTTEHCPKLGFDDDPNNSFGRPTRLHRCFAAGAPLPLSLDQQRELCLSDQFGTCPRLTMAGFVLPAREQQPHSNLQAPRRPVPHRPESESDDSRIVHLPFVGRASEAERGAVADRQAVGGSEPTRLRSIGAPVRDAASSPPPTPLRSRIERAGGFDAAGAAAEPPTPPTPEARATASHSLGEALADAPTQRRVGPIPVGALSTGLVVLVTLAVIVYLLGPHVGDWLADDTLDPSSLPNTSAVAAGTPVAQVTAPRATPVARATAAAAAPDEAADTGVAATSVTPPSPAGAASTISAAAAAPAPTLPPAPSQASAQTPAAQPAAAQPAAAQSGPAQPAPAQSAVTTLFDERFTNNDRRWPSTPQSAAFLNNGSYLLVPRLAGQFVAVGAPIADTLKDVVVNATFHKVSGPLGGGYGIIVRDQATVPQNGTVQDGQYYVLEVGDKGEVGMWRRDGDHWVDLLPWQPNPAVKIDTASNDLSVRAIGNRLSLSVNGTLVATKTDDTFSAGRVGLFVGGDGNQVSVDRFSIQSP